MKIIIKLEYVKLLADCLGQRASERDEKVRRTNYRSENKVKKVYDVFGIEKYQKLKMFFFLFHAL